MSDDLEGATDLVPPNVKVPDAGAFAAYWNAFAAYWNALGQWERDRLFEGIRRAQESWFEQQMRLPELEQLREMRAALVAPWDLYAAVSETWSSITQDDDGSAHSPESADQVVLKRLRTMSDLDLQRAGFVLAIVRSLAMATRAER